MTHLSPGEFVDAAEGTLAAGRAAHLERCSRCAAQAVTVREALDAAALAEVPEPSPLYWQHLSARVRDRVAQETIVPAWRATPWREYVTARTLVPAASALALAGAVMVSVLLLPRRPPASLPYETAAIVATSPADLAIEPEDSEVWQVLTSAAADVPIEDAHAAGMAVPAGAVDRAVQRMTPDELTELRRLLQSELRGAGD
jgi:hypothetical protein